MYPRERGSAGKLSLPGRPHSLPGWLLYSVAVLLLRGRVPPSVGPPVAIMQQGVAPDGLVPGPEVSGPRPRWAFRLPRRLQLMAEPYLKASKAILHTTAELFPGGQSLMCVLFPVKRPGAPAV